MPKYSVRDPKTGRFVVQEKPFVAELASRGLPKFDLPTNFSGYVVQDSYAGTIRPLTDEDITLVPKLSLWTRIKVRLGRR